MAEPTEDVRRWWQRPNRILLLNLREGDEPKIDAEAMVRDAKSFGATAFCVSGGGIVAFYKTEVPHHSPSRALGDRDLLAEIVPVAHREDIKVLARIDSSCARKELAEEHPEWFTRTAAGEFCEVSGHYVTCPNGGYYHGRMVEIVREILEKYGADGIWNNQGKFGAWETGLCYCDTCRTLFRDEHGHELPIREDWEDPVWRSYNEWRYRRIAAWVQHMNDAVHAIRPEAIFISAIQLAESLETIRPGGWDVDYWADHQDVLTFECQRRHTAPWWPGIQSKYLATLAEDRPRWMTASYFYPWWRLYASPETENRPWIAQQFANGVCTWLHINGGYSDYFDRRSLGPMREVMMRQARWEPYFDNARSAAEVALVFSRYSQDNYGRAQPQARYTDFVRGAYMALQEAHIPFDVVSDKLLDDGRLSRYRVLVLPNAACLSDDAAAAIERFVARGGGVVASFDTGRFDAMGNPRDRDVFERMFGRVICGRREDLKSSYARIENASDPLLMGIGDTDLLPNDGALNESTVVPGTTVPLTLIPSIQAYAGATISIPDLSGVVETTRIPVVTCSQFGAGRAIWFANENERLFYRYGFPDLGLVYANAVRHAAGDALALGVQAPDFVDVTHMVQPNRTLVHLVNLPVGKPLATGWRPIGRNLVAVYDIGIRLRDDGRTVREVRRASDEQPLAFTQSDGWIRATVPRLDDHEIVVFEFQP